ncbi:unnamed protein product [Candida parapsilosis]
MSIWDQAKKEEFPEEEADKVWLYINLEITPDPIILQDETKSKEYEQIDIDLITWRTLITTSLGKMYGLIGESLPFDIPAKLSSKSIILKIQTQDKEKFSNSSLSYTFNLNKYTDLDANCYIKIKKVPTMWHW